MDTPSLTDLQRLVLANLLLGRENAQLKLDLFLKDVTVPGYDLQTNGDYVRKADPPKPAAP